MPNNDTSRPSPRPFVRSMKVFGVLLLTLSAITPASSAFVIIPGIIQQAGTWALISLAAAALVATAMAFVYAELASAWPLAGGEYAMAGRTLGPFAGFVLMGSIAVASNLALTVGARGGVYIGGGIVPRFGAYLAASAFRRRFEDKGRFTSYLAAIPTYVIRAENPGLIGAARYLDSLGQTSH